VCMLRDVRCGHPVTAEWGGGQLFARSTWLAGWPAGRSRYAATAAMSGRAPAATRQQVPQQLCSTGAATCLARWGDVLCATLCCAVLCRVVLCRHGRCWAHHHGNHSAAGWGRRCGLQVRAVTHCTGDIEHEECVCDGWVVSVAASTHSACVGRAVGAAPQGRAAHRAAACQQPKGGGLWHGCGAAQRVPLQPAGGFLGASGGFRAASGGGGGGGTAVQQGTEVWEMRGVSSL
jgi:hypothetical protein